MDNTHQDKDEPLVEGLVALPDSTFRFPNPPEGMKASLFERTGRVVVARARRRRFFRLLIVAAAYIGGITTAFLISDGRGRLTRHDAPRVEATRDAGESMRDRVVDPDELVRRAKDASVHERVLLLTQAGDLFLSARYDVEKALSCYSRALDVMPASERTRVAPDDTWLLAALKDSKR